MFLDSVFNSGINCGLKIKIFSKICLFILEYLIKLINSHNLNKKDSMKSALNLSLLMLLLLKNNDMITLSETVNLSSSLDYHMDEGYDKNQRPSEYKDTTTFVDVGLFINRISAVEENKELSKKFQEISFDVFLQVIWTDLRIRPRETNLTRTKNFTELQIEERQKIWVPDLYIRQLKEMKIIKLFEDISSLRLYQNSTIVLSIGATIIIKCDMDFVLYPLDVQKCPVDFSSYKYSRHEMEFHWKRGNAITYPNDFGNGFFRLPKYVVSFHPELDMRIINYGDEDHSSARLEITLSREVKSYLLENYLPSTLFVSMSWGSFVVVPEVVPGRMVLLVTTLLSLITMFDTVRNNSPDALELKCLEVWLISCTLFVFLALMEYFIVLFGIRYDKHWRTSKTLIPGLVSPPINLAASGMSSETPMTTFRGPRKNGIEHAARGFQLNRVNPETKTIKSNNSLSPNLPASSEHPNSTQTQPQISENEDASTIDPTNNSNPMHRRRFRNAAEYALLYAGSQRGRLDQISLVLFPLSFLVFAIVYWVLYLSESRKKI
ncbi:glycine receptor subunit alpha-2-like isoform X2 [Eupeodes corollae]|uniref:glycine receptor subunit alpha-2-like isoform X2 n=1 Tax=Eupeodes corollae TaxID=290404 RepID=UPI002490CD08|nr:glycine receptor subunit alpha-2-like isoform X2 [Eupeodes corollae]